jgi:hypothetical protein
MMRLLYILLIVFCFGYNHQKNAEGVHPRIVMTSIHKSI